MVLGYYQGDFYNQGSLLNSQGSQHLPALQGRDLYNGNISSWEMGTLASDSTWMRTGFQYAYDKLNRIRSSSFSVHKDDGFIGRGAFGANYTLDANGNLKTLSRRDIDAEQFDDFIYHLEEGTNKLLNVEDNATLAADKHHFDLKHQEPNNYEYDAIGNLVRDNQEAMDIAWTVYGKVANISKDAAAGATTFLYDAAGNRVAKKHINAQGNTNTHYYLRDASGNVMAIYNEQDLAIGGGKELRVQEIPIYGSDRLGMYKPSGVLSNSNLISKTIQEDIVVSTFEGLSYELEDGVTITLQPGFEVNSATDGVFTIGTSLAEFTLAPSQLDRKLYELKDHLGNVRTLVTDRKQGDLSGSTPQDIRPTIVSAAAYYPYGMEMPTVMWGDDVYLATYENEHAVEEYAKFLNYGNADRKSIPIFNHTPCDGCLQEPTRAQMLNALPGGIIGLAKSLRVQAGDQVDMEVYGKYIQPSAGAQNTNALALIAAPLLQAFGVPVPPEGLSVLQTTASDIAAGGVFLNKTPEDPTVQAYLNYLLFDDDFVFQSAGFIMLSEAAKVTSPETQHERLSIDLPITKDGYLYTYLSNESSKVAEVYFDDYKITHRKLVPDVAYGTEAVAYRYGFNGKEKDQSGEWGLTAYDYGFRIYNPALGRFLSVDPLTKSYPMLTPYQFASNTPIMAIDLDGLEAVITIGEKQNDGQVIQIFQEVDASEMTQNIFQKSYPGLNKTGSVSLIVDKNGWLLEYQHIPEMVIDGRKMGKAEAAGRDYGRIMGNFFVGDNEDAKVARKMVYGMIGLATGISGGVTFLGIVEGVISANDIFSGSIMAADQQSKDIDLIKDRLVQIGGQEVGNLFDLGKVTLGVVGMYKTGKDIQEESKLFLNFESEKVANEFLKLFGGAITTADDVMELTEK